MRENVAAAFREVTLGLMEWEGPPVMRDERVMRERYQHGRETGAQWARFDRANGAACDARSEDLREDAASAVYWATLGRDQRRYAAFCLGVARGYREVIR